MHVIAYNLRIYPEYTADYIKMTDWDSLFSCAGFITLHMPLTKDNVGRAGKYALERMKPGAHLINCAGEGSADEKALAETLRNGKIAGAFLDVLNGELFGLNIAIIHINDAAEALRMASNTAECMREIACEAACRIHKVLSDEIPDYASNHSRR